MREQLLVFLLLFTSLSLAQTKISGEVFDEFGEPVPFANVIFKDSQEGTITNENGRFYLESDKTYDTAVVSFLGYTTKEVPLSSRTTYNMKIELKT